MEPITIAMGLAQFVPQLIKWITNSDTAESVAQKAIDIANTVTGQSTGDASLKALQANPDLILKYRVAVLDQELEFEKLAVQNAADINKTMQTETGADHWPSYSWRPFIGFTFGFYICSLFVLPLVGKTPVILSSEMTIAIGGILGIASWFRGKMQADPNVQSSNKG